MKVTPKSLVLLGGSLFAVALMWQVPRVRTALAQSRASQAILHSQPYSLIMREYVIEKNGKSVDVSRITKGRFADGTAIRIQRFLSDGFELIDLERSDGVSMRALGREKLRSTIRRNAADTSARQAGDYDPSTDCTKAYAPLPNTLPLTILERTSILGTAVVKLGPAAPSPGAMYTWRAPSLSCAVLKLDRFYADNNGSRSTH